MNAPKVKLFALALFLGMGVAHAELGDTMDVAQARYGEPSERRGGKEGMVYGLWNWKGFNLAISFRNGVSWRESVKRVSGVPLTSRDFAQWLPSPQWQSLWPGLLQWESMDKKAVATYTQENCRLDVYSREWLAVHNEVRWLLDHTASSRKAPVVKSIRTFMPVR